MNSRKVIEYLKTLYMIKLRVAEELKVYEGVQDREFNAKIKGRMQAYQDFIAELEAIDSDIVAVEMANESFHDTN